MEDTREDVSRSKKVDVQVVGWCSDTLANYDGDVDLGIAAGNGHKQHSQYPVL